MLVRFFFCCFVLTFQTAQAMLLDGMHSLHDYIQFSHSRPSFDAVCYLYDQKNNIMQTGVLIGPRLIATAAHGIVDGVMHAEDPSLRQTMRQGEVMMTKGLFVGFGEQMTTPSLGFFLKRFRSWVRDWSPPWGFHWLKEWIFEEMRDNHYVVRKAIVDPRYFSAPPGEKAKYDIAFLILEEEPTIKPVPILKTGTMQQNQPVYVGTFGGSDLGPHQPNLKRAFVLPELDRFYPASQDSQTFDREKNVLFSSIFFKPSVPSEGHPETSGAEDEKEARTLAANKNWHRLHHPPFALCLPGTSGAPVFVELTMDGKTQDYVLGLISSFAPLAASNFEYADSGAQVHYILTSDLERIYGQYQSIFVVFYHLKEHLLQKQENQQEISSAEWSFTLDPEIKQLIEKLEG